jgi:hypothetical protein
MRFFFGKASIYFKCMNKALPQQFQEYIGKARVRLVWAC